MISDGYRVHERVGGGVHLLDGPPLEAPLLDEVVWGRLQVDADDRPAAGSVDEGEHSGGTTGNGHARQRARNDSEIDHRTRYTPKEADKEVHGVTTRGAVDDAVAGAVESSDAALVVNDGVAGTREAQREGDEGPLSHKGLLGRHVEGLERADCRLQWSVDCRVIAVAHPQTRSGWTQPARLAEAGKVSLNTPAG